MFPPREFSRWGRCTIGPAEAVTGWALLMRPQVVCPSEKELASELLIEFGE